jgi:hypothetical protein
MSERASCRSGPLASTPASMAKEAICLPAGRMPPTARVTVPVRPVPGRWWRPWSSGRRPFSTLGSPPYPRTCPKTTLQGAACRLPAVTAGRVRPGADARRGRDSRHLARPSAPAATTDGPCRHPRPLITSAWAHRASWRVSGPLVKSGRDEGVGFSEPALPTKASRHSRKRGRSAGLARHAPARRLPGWSRRRIHAGGVVSGIQPAAGTAYPPPAWRRAATAARSSCSSG